MAEYNLAPCQVSIPFSKSPWRSKNKKKVAENIVIIIQNIGNRFRIPFSYSQYENMFHEPVNARKILDEFVEEGFLKKEPSGKYKVGMRMMAIFWQNLQEEVI